jgi:hypothetical protein
MDTTFLSERIAKTKELIVAYDDAILALLSGNHQKYMLNTGQSEQQVTRLDLDSLQKTKDALYSQLNDLEARLGNGESVITVIPGY